MPPAPSDWRLALARIEGALPFLSESLAQALAQRCLRRLWAVHIRDYSFENMAHLKKYLQDLMLKHLTNHRNLLLLGLNQNLVQSFLSDPLINALCEIANQS